MPNITIGFLGTRAEARSRQDRARDGRGRRWARLLAARKRLDEVYAAYGEPDADFDALAERAGEARSDPVRARRRRPRAAARDRRRRVAPAAVGRQDRPALGRREAPRRAVPAAALEAGHAAARRADEPSRCGERRVARAVPAALPRHRRRRHARSLLPRQRRRMDPRTRSRPRHPVEGQLQFVARSETSSGSPQEEATESARQKALKRELEWVRTGTKGRQAKSKSRIARFEELSSYEYQRRNETQEIFIPVAERLGDRGDRVHRRAQSLRRPAA